MCFGVLAGKTLNIQGQRKTEHPFIILHDERKDLSAHT